MGLWSDLPGELLIKFEGYLTLHVDKVRIRAVCQSWNSYLPKMTMPDKLPSLLGVFENQNKSVSLFNLVEQKHDTLYIPEMQGKLFIGSSYGWVAMIEDFLDDDDNESDDDDYDDEDEDIPRPTFPRSSPDIYLINPFTGVQIRLPPRNTFPDVKEYCADKVGREYAMIGSRNIRFMDSNVVHKYLLRKIVMSSSPLQEGCIVVAIYGELGTLAWCKCNDNSWTPVYNTDYNIEFRFPHLPCKDAIFHKNRLHALRLTGELVVIENIGTNQKVVETEVGYAPLRPFCPYLAESSDGEELLMVVHLHNDDGENGGFVGFDVYKLNAETCSWYKIDNIGDDVLFLGRHSSSLSINAHNVPGFKGNRIYFANESYGYDPSDDERRAEGLLATKVGVYNLADRTVESLSGFESVFKLRWPVPIWVTSPS